MISILYGGFYIMKKAEELGMKETIEQKENEIRPRNTIGQIFSSL